MPASAPFFIRTRAPVQSSTAWATSGLCATSRTCRAEAGRDAFGIEAPAGQLGCDLHREPERLAREQRRVSRAHARARQARVERHAERLQRRAGGARLLPALLRQRPLGVGPAVRVLRVRVTQQPDHRPPAAPAAAAASADSSARRAGSWKGAGSRR